MQSEENVISRAEPVVNLSAHNCGIILQNVGSEPRETKPRSGQSFTRLLHIGDLYDTAFCLWVLGILHRGYVQIFLAFAEGDIGCAISGRDGKDVEQIALRRDFQNLATKPLGNVNVPLAVDLHAIRPEPPGLVLVFYEQI